MSFYKKYELDRLLADGPAKTFRAVESATSRIFFLHLFNPSGLPLLEVLRGKLTGPGGKPIEPLIELGEFAGAPYAVTTAIEPFSSFEEWLANLGTTSSVVPEAPAHPPPPEVLSNEPPAGDFTRIFGQAFGPSLTPAAPAPKPVPSQEGDFTRVFGSAPAAQKREAPPGPAVPRSTNVPEYPLSQQSLKPITPNVTRRPAPEAQTAWPPASANRETPVVDDFDRMTGKAAPIEPAMPDRPRAAATPQEPGEYTQIFGSSLQGESINIESEQARAARADLPESKPFQQAGDFTRVFGHRPGSKAPVASDIPANGPSSGIFDSLATRAQFSPQIVSKLPQVDRDVPIVDDYARMTGPSSPPGLAVPQSPPSVPAHTGRDKTLLIVGALAVVLLLTVILLAVLLLRNH
jgi:hypothetical protein